MKYADSRGIKTRQWFTNEMLRQEDINRMGRETYQNIHDLLLTFSSIPTGSEVFKGLDLVFTSGLNTTLKAGTAISHTGSYMTADAWGFVADPDDSFVVMVPEDQILAFDTGVGQPDRIDIVEIRPVEINTDSLSRNFKDPITSLISTAIIPTGRQYSYEVAVRKGSSMVPVATTAGWVKIAEVTILASATAISKVSGFADSGSWVVSPGSTVPAHVTNTVKVSDQGLFARWDLDDMEVIPTSGVASDIVYYADNFIGYDSGWTAAGDNSVFVTDGMLVANNVITDSIFITKTPLAFTRNEFRLKIVRNDALTMVAYYDTVGATWRSLTKSQVGVFDYWYIRTPTTANVDLQLRFDILHGTPVYISTIYLGTGKYALPGPMNKSMEYVSMQMNACMVKETKAGRVYGYEGVHQYWGSIDYFRVPEKLWIHAVQTTQYDALEKSIFGTYVPGAGNFSISMIAGALRVRWEDGALKYADIPNVPDGTHDFFFDFESEVFKLYVNGIFWSTISMPGVLRPSPAQYYFGFIYGGLTTSVRIGTDQFVRIYTRELSPSEVWSLHIDPTQGMDNGLRVDTTGSIHADPSDYIHITGKAAYKPVEASIPIEVSASLFYYRDTYPRVLNTGLGFTAAPVRVAHNRVDKSCMFLHNGTTSHLHALYYGAEPDSYGATASQFNIASVSLGSVGPIPYICKGAIATTFYWARITGGTTLNIGCVKHDTVLGTLSYAERTLRAGMTTPTVHCIANISNNRYIVTYLDGGVEYAEIFDDDETNITVYGSRYATSINAPTYVIDTSSSNKFVLYTLTNYIWVCTNAIAVITQNATTRLTSPGYAATDNTIIKITENTGSTMQYFVVVHRDPLGTMLTRINTDATTAITVGAQTRFPLAWSSGDTRDTLFIDVMGGNISGNVDFLILLASKGIGLSKSMLIKYTALTSAFSAPRFYVEREGYEITAPASIHQVVLGTTDYNAIIMSHNATFVNTIETRSEYRLLYVCGRNNSRQSSGVMKYSREGIVAGDRLYAGPHDGYLVPAHELPMRSDGMPYYKRPPLVGIMINDTEMKIVEWASSEVK